MWINVQSTALNPISPYLYMQFMEPLGTADSSVDACWDFVKDEWHSQFIEISRKLGPTMLRWGGCFASYYHWHEAVGPLTDRKPMLNLCWDGIYSNAVGTKELADLSKAINSELLLVVNMESDGRMHWAYPREGENRFGTSQEAAEWVDYCNNPMNKLRIAHGDRQPYNVKWWQIGNETSYDKKGYNMEKAAEVTLAFAKEMRAADPSIKLIAWGDDGWTPHMCQVAGDYIDYISFHHHFGSGLPDSPLYGTEYRTNPENTWKHLMHAHHSLKEHIEKMREEAAPYGKKLCMTEGHFALPGRNRCEVLSSWMAGAAYARCLNVIIRNSDILEIATMADFCGNRWQVNAIMMPTPLRTNRPYLQPVGEVMRLFRHNVGDYQVAVSASDEVDVVASRTDKCVYLHIVNISLHESQTLHFTIDNVDITSATVYQIAPADPTLEITELIPDAFTPAEQQLSGNVYLLPPAAVAVVKIPL
ncbi:MAG: alpha-L-arabinofuranosidase [Christensenellales bacterium]|jgi:alpha-N-arabinofuranosidase